MWKVLPHSTTISQKYRKPLFSMQFVPVFVLGVSLASTSIKFSESTVQSVSRVRLGFGEKKKKGSYGSNSYSSVTDITFLDFK